MKDEGNAESDGLVCLLEAVDKVGDVKLSSQEGRRGTR